MQGERRRMVNIHRSPYYFDATSNILTWKCFYECSGRVTVTCQGLTRPRKGIGSHPCWLGHLAAVQTVPPRAATDQTMSCRYGSATMSGIGVVTD